MEDFLQEVMRLDAGGDYSGIVRLTEAAPHGPLPWTIYRLLEQQRFFEAYMTAKLLLGIGDVNPVTRLAQALGGLLFNDADDLRNGTIQLQAGTDRLPPEREAILAKQIVQPIVQRIVLANARGLNNLDYTLAVLDILAAAQSCLRVIFDMQADAPPPNRHALISQGRKQARLLTFPTHPAGEAVAERRVVLAMRERVFPQDHGSRLLDVGPRIATAMRSYGWRPVMCSLHFRDVIADFQSIAASCIQEQAAVLVMDDYYILNEQIHPIRAETLAELRRRIPGIQIVALHLDPWEIAPATLTSTTASVDFVWTPFPSMALWNEPAFAGKMIYIPLPNAGTASTPMTPLSGTMTFVGSIVGYNWHRVFWMAAARRHDLPIRFQLSNHTADNLPPIDSYQAYIRRLEATGCALNFSMRPDLSRVITGRSFEAILAGALLAQEANPDMDYYFVSGEHYLSFSTFSELRAITRFVAEHPDDAEQIRRAGNSFATATYHDHRLVGHLDYRLSGRP